MAQKVAIITGGSCGIGLKATEKLVQRNFHCIIASRNLDNVNSAVQKIKQVTGRENVEGMKLDLCDFDSIRAFVNDFSAKNLPLHVLVNNAGIQGLVKNLTNTGIETTFAANHLGHFLLTNLLLDKLKASAPARIVVVSSTMHDPARGIGKSPELPIEEYNFESRPFDGVAAYRFSKLANLLFTYDLHRRLEGTGVIVNALCPGWIPSTGLARDYPFWMRFLFTGILSIMPFTRSLDHGAECVVDLAVKEDKEITEGGHYFSDRKLTPSTARSLDADEQRKLWDLSVRLTGL